MLKTSLKTSRLYGDANNAAGKKRDASIAVAETNAG